MTRWRGISVAGLGAVALFSAGCGEIAYKTGAGSDQLQADEKTCRRGAGETDAYRACMKEKGWSIASLEGDEPAPLNAAPVPVATAPAPTIVGGIPPAQPPASSPPAPPVVAAPPQKNPQTPVPVSGWIKFGGSDPSGAIATCVATLGPAHQPDTTHHTVTTALVACMREQGWRAL